MVLHSVPRGNKPRQDLAKNLAKNAIPVDTCSFHTTQCLFRVLYKYIIWGVLPAKYAVVVSVALVYNRLLLGGRVLLKRGPEFLKQPIVNTCFSRHIQVISCTLALK